MKRVAAMVGAILATAGVASADDRPLTVPARDVDITYMMVQPDAPGGPRMLEQRMRYDVGDGKLRVDPPTPGLYMIVDYRTRRMETIRVAERMVIDVDAGTGAVVPGGGSAAKFDRQGETQVAGLTCTNWKTSDAAGQPTMVCLTPDGVMLRAIGGGRILVEAAEVRYGPVDKAAFEIPADFRHVGPAAKSPKPAPR